MFIHVNEVRYEGGYKLRLVFNDASVRLVDLKDELTGQIFEPLRDESLFQRVRVNNDTGTVEWPNGADMALEFLYEIGIPVTESPTRKVAEGKTGYNI